MHELREIADGLWEVQFPFSILGVKLGRRMVVVRLEDGSLQLHSPGPIDSALKARIERLGPVSAIIAPTAFHDTFIREALDVFPGVPFHVVNGFPKVFPRGREPRLLNDAPDLWAKTLAWKRIAGIPRLNEHVFLHRATRTLLVADLVFNITPAADTWTRAFFRLNGAYNALRPTRIFRAQIKDTAAFLKAVDEVLQWDFDRLVPTHGAIVESGARDRFKREFSI